jgi:pimeloyl-ACP methyl ester carboxylesterase
MAKPISRTVTLHGQEISYHSAGEGSSVVVLLHGIAGTSATWDGVLPALGEHHTVIVPDLLGHGQSGKLGGDYSLGAYASAVRDLLFALGHRRATVVGHSLGGGVAMQFGYQFPEMLERLVLVSSGGLGRELHVLLRSAALPGAEYVLPLLFKTGLPSAGTRIAGLVNRLGFRAGPDLEEIGRSFASLGDTDTRQTFIHTVRGLIDPGGQRVDASSRLYLATELPILIIWGARDTLIPVEHGRAAHSRAPRSKLVIFERAGHFPHLSEPQRFVEVVERFIAETEPAELDGERLRQLLVGEGGEMRTLTAARRAADSRR